MSFAYKSLKTSDISVYEYKASKGFTFASSSFGTDGIRILSGSNDNIGENQIYPTTLLYYRSLRHLYYSNYLNSLAPTQPLSTLTYEELIERESVKSNYDNKLGYENYIQSTAASGTYDADNRYALPTSTGITVIAISIPAALYGENIKPGSFILKDTGSRYNIIDDSNGNLIVSSSREYVGNLIYSHGIATILNSNYRFFNTSSYNISFSSSITLYQNKVKCTIGENEFNITQNPSAISSSDGAYYPAFTGSDFRPYVTTIGLYNAANELLAVGKLSNPVPISSNIDTTFIVKYDT